VALKLTMQVPARELSGVQVESLADTVAPEVGRSRPGLLSGGYGQDELERAGAYRVYQDPADLLRHLDEVGVRPTQRAGRRRSFSATEAHAPAPTAFRLDAVPGQPS